MAWREVEEDEYVVKGDFLKAAEVFAKIGDRFVGVYVGAAEGIYGLDVTFKANVDGTVAPVCLTVKGALRKQIEKAGLQTGSLVGIQFKATKDIGKESPMKQFKVMVDDAFTGQPMKNGPNVKLRARDNAPPPQTDADVPF